MAALKPSTDQSQFKSYQKSVMESSVEFICAFCGEANPTFIDLSAGSQQSYVEDCQVCCQPNVLYISVNEDTLEVEVHSDCES